MPLRHVGAELRASLLDLKNTFDPGIVLRFLDGHVIQIRHLILVHHRRSKGAEDGLEQHDHHGHRRHRHGTHQHAPLAATGAAGLLVLVPFPAGIIPLRLMDGDGHRMAGHGADGPGRLVILLRAQVRKVEFHLHLRILPEGLQIRDHGVRRLIAVLQIRGHGLHADQFQLLGNIGIDLPRSQRNGAEVLDGHRNGGLSFKGQPPGEHLVKHHAGGINIAAGVRPVAPCLLRGNIVDGAKSLLCQGLGGIRQTGDAEIGHLHAAVPQDHDVLGLDVPVDDATAVGVAEAPHDLGDEVQRLPPVQLAPLFHILLEGDAVDQLHDDIFHIAAP